MKLRRVSQCGATLIAAVAITLYVSKTLSAQEAPAQASSDLVQMLGISFPADSPGSVVLTRDGKRYLIDTHSKTIQQIGGGAALIPVSTARHTAGANNGAVAALFQKNCASCHGADGKGNKSIGTPNFTDPGFIHGVSADEMRTAIQKGKNGIMPAWSGRLSENQISDLVAYVRSLPQPPPGPQSGSVSSSSDPSSAQLESHTNIYKPGDDLLISLPTGKTTDDHGVYVNFTHRFAYDTTFTGPSRGEELFGLDNIAIASFGVRYGITDRFSVSAYRSSSLVDRPIQLMAGYNILEEEKDNPFNLMVRVSVEGQDNFRKNYTENVEGIFSRSITHRAQVYVVPTISFNDRLLLQPVGFFSSGIPDVPGVTAFSLGTGLSVDVRPTVAVMAEVIPTLLNATELDIHRPVFAFGIQKKIWRHAFTLGFTTSPGTTVSQRAATRASFLGEPGADTLGGLSIGFDLTRQIR